MLPSLYKNIILQKENTVHLFKNTYTRAWYAKRENGFIPIGADELAKIAGLFNIDINKISIFFANSVPKKEQ